MDTLDFDPVKSMDRAFAEAKAELALERAQYDVAVERCRSAFEPLLQALRTMLATRVPMTRPPYYDKTRQEAPVYLTPPKKYSGDSDPALLIVLPTLEEGGDRGVLQIFYRSALQLYQVGFNTRPVTPPPIYEFNHWIAAYEQAVKLMSRYITRFAGVGWAAP